MTTFEILKVSVALALLVAFGICSTYLLLRDLKNVGPFEGIDDEHLFIKK